MRDEIQIGLKMVVFSTSPVTQLPRHFLLLNDRERKQNLQQAAPCKVCVLLLVKWVMLAGKRHCC